MQKNFAVVAKQGELDRELRVETSNQRNAYSILRKQKINKKWDFKEEDVREVDKDWNEIVVVEEVGIVEEIEGGQDIE